MQYMKVSAVKEINWKTFSCQILYIKIKRINSNRNVNEWFAKDLGNAVMVVRNVGRRFD